jgi:hypothetical protein
MAAFRLEADLLGVSESTLMTQLGHVCQKPHHDWTAGVYRLITPVGELAARAVVIASGSLNHARRPEVARALPSGLLQIDTSVYRNRDALPHDPLLIVPKLVRWYFRVRMGLNLMCRILVRSHRGEM